jgi:transposase
MDTKPCIGGTRTAIADILPPDTGETALAAAAAALTPAGEAARAAAQALAKQASAWAAARLQGGLDPFCQLVCRSWLHPRPGGTVRRRRLPRQPGGTHAPTTDFRKGAHGLAALAQEVLAEDPFSGTIIVYRSKRADRVKILVWDTSGLVLIWKQLQQGSFRWPPIMDGVVKLSPVEFAALFDGIDWTRVQTTKGILKPTVAA